MTHYPRARLPRSLVLITAMVRLTTAIRLRQSRLSHSERSAPKEDCRVASSAQLAIQFTEQGFGVFQVGGVQAFGEPAVDVGEHRARLVASALFASKRARLVVARSSHDLALCLRAISIAR